MVSTFRNVLDFFNDLGIYDVILPFLLVFTMIFAILEKTKILGTEEINGKPYSKKSLNAMVAFTSAFFVVASAKAVAIINQSIAQVFILLLMAVLFLMLFGTFYGEKEDIFTALGTKTRLAIGAVFGIGIVLIFLNAVGWLETGWNFLMSHWDSNAVASIILMIVVVAFMAWITTSKDGGTPAADKPK